MDLSGGTGYIFTNGTYKKITWEKGNDNKSNFVFKDENGNTVQINKGKSYIALIPAEKSSLTKIA